MVKIRLLVSLVLAITLLSMISALDVNITSPANVSYSEVVPSLHLNITEIDSSNISKIEFFLNGFYDSTTLVSETGRYDYNSTEGDNFWKIAVTDKEGIQINTSVSFWVDSISPSISLVNPTTLISYTNGDALNLIINLNELNKGGFNGIGGHDASLNYIYRKFFYPAFAGSEEGSYTINANNDSDCSLANPSVLAQGNYNYLIKARDIYPNGTMIREVNLTGTIIRDTIAPTYLNLQNQSNNTYYPGKTYDFLINWTDERTPIDSVWIVFNGETTYTNNFTATDLSAGQYNYIWYARDSAGNIGNTGLLTYNVEKATTICYLEGESVQYPNQVNMTASCNNEQGSLKLYRNGTDITAENSQLVSLSFGEYFYLANIDETSNYTAGSINKTITVSKGIGNVSLLINNLFEDFSGELPQEILINASLENGEGTINVYLNNTLISSGTNSYNGSKNLELGYYNLTVTYSGNENYTLDSKTLWINITDTTSPTIGEIQFPNNNPFEIGQDIIIEFNISDASDIDSCSLFLDSVLNNTITNLTQGINYNFTLSNLPAGQHNYSIICYDVLNNNASTPISYFTILPNLTNENDFTDYTNLSNEQDISNVLYFFVANSHGIINWTSPIDFSAGNDWTQNINISFNKAFVNSTAMPELNTNAIITLFNVNYTTPEVLRDGIVCTDCTWDYNSTTDTLIINVNGFSEYSVRETPVPVYSSGGGGGSSCTISSWTYGNWSECDSSSYTQERILTSNCRTTKTESQLCVPEGFVNNNTQENLTITESEETLDEQGGITGSVIGVRALQITGAIMFIALIIAGWFFVKSKKNNAIRQRTQEILHTMDD